jgi:predicted ribosome quality control (RQC) complex YloA/Tae2 family protein
MLTDWALVRRLGAEVGTRLCGARLQDAGSLPDGRPALSLWRRGESALLCIDAFGSPPAVTLEHGELSVTGDTTFTRALAGALRGTYVRAVEARHGDRVLRLLFGIRSRFGVDDEIDLWIELVPRFGNAILVKGGRVVRALKEFTAANNPRRAVSAGLTYALPPLSSDRPTLPRLVAQSGADALDALVFLESDEALRSQLYVYRRSGSLVQAHLLPLPQLEDVSVTREGSLLDLLLENRVANVTLAQPAAHRRNSIARRLARHALAADRALQQLQTQRAEVSEREQLSAEGTRIFATLHEFDPAERAAAKKRAQSLFDRYRRLGQRARHLDEREQRLHAQREAIEALLWELERSSDEGLSDVEAALAALDPRSAGGRSRKTRERRAPLEYRGPNGSRVLVGRSPIDNAELTFRIARPNDLWFHARGTPGAHVILTRDDRLEPSAEDIAFAASIAAAHSKARESAKVVVDYTTRKFVRKQRDAPPGMVYYTGARSITVEPKAP